MLSRREPVSLHIRYRHPRGLNQNSQVPNTCWRSSVLVQLQPVVKTGTLFGGTLRSLSASTQKLTRSTQRVAKNLLFRPLSILTLPLHGSIRLGSCSNATTFRSGGIQ